MAKTAMDVKHALADWIDGRTSQAKFADQVGCSESHLSLVLRGKRGVSMKLARKLSEATGGDVPLDAFLIDPTDTQAHQEQPNPAV